MKIILVAEDDKFLSNAYRIKLMKLGYDVVILSDGEQVMHYLHDNSVPDLLLLDLIMPIKDGFDTLREIKVKGLKKFPIIVASNLGEGEDIRKAKELGAIDYIIKSDLSLQELADKINSYLV